MVILQKSTGIPGQNPATWKNPGPAGPYSTEQYFFARDFLLGNRRDWAKAAASWPAGWSITGSSAAVIVATYEKQNAKTKVICEFPRLSHFGLWSGDHVLNPVFEGRETRTPELPVHSPQEALGCYLQCRQALDGYKADHEIRAKFDALFNPGDDYGFARAIGGSMWWGGEEVFIQEAARYVLQYEQNNPGPVRVFGIHGKPGTEPLFGQWSGENTGSENKPSACRGRHRPVRGFEQCLPLISTGEDLQALTNAGVPAEGQVPSDRA